MTADRFTVDGVLTDGTHVLLIRRAKDPYKGMLAFPGGRVDPGEDLLTAVVRELDEEVGLVLDPTLLLPLTVLNAPGRDPRPGHVAAHVFCTHVDRTVLESARAASDAKSVHIMRLDEIDKVDMAFDHYLAIEKLRELLDH
ncbi:MAG: NUDIX hydrolase [Parcubacteria group bacterium]|nr:NUDIX hydrolase [Parcubacteria group bacterium]